jgi:uncharacterized protein (DUF1501 family)
MKNNNTQRRDFLRTATSLAVASGLPTLDTLTNLAHAAGGVTPTDVADDYKAIVCVFLYGGQDHSNIVIPYADSGGGTAEYDRYVQARKYENAAQDQNSAHLAYLRSNLAATTLPATSVNSLTGNASPSAGGWTTNTFGRQFAMNPEYKELRALYNAPNSKLAVIANTGPLLSPVNRHQWYTDTFTSLPVSLYSHDDMQKNWMSGTADIANPDEGIGGRIAAQMASMNGAAPISISVSVAGSNAFMLTNNNAAIPYQIGTGAIGRIGQSTDTPPKTICNSDTAYVANPANGAYCVRGGPIEIKSGYSYYSQMRDAFQRRVTAAGSSNNVYLNQWRGTMDQSIKTEIAVRNALTNSPPNELIVEPFNGVTVAAGEFNPLAAQLQMVAALIRASTQLGAGTPATPLKRQIFFVGIGGFDTHGSDFWVRNPELNRKISKSINAFWTAMGNIKVRGQSTGSAQDKVTLFTMSDFGRTLDSNGKGCDHGWGAHHIVLGGAVKGGQIYGADHNVAAGQIPNDAEITSQKSRYMSVDANAGAMPRYGIPPLWYEGTQGNTGPGGKTNGLNHALDRGELLPTMASDAYVATVARWFGVTEANLFSTFPKLQGAHSSFSTASGVGFMTI